MFTTRFLCPALIALLLSFTAVHSANAEPTSKSVYENAVTSVVAIIPDLEGEDTTIGTGWILDAKRNLVLTNHHVIEGATKCRVYFPLMKNGKLVSDHDATLDDDRAIWADVIDSSFDRDLALIRLDNMPENANTLRLAKDNASPGETIHSIAGSAEGTQGLWAYSTGHVRQRVMGGLANGGQTMVLESDMATNRGNSGGPVLNDRGEVVAVVEGHMEDARLVSIYVDRESIVEYLREAKSSISPTTAEDYVKAAKRNQVEGRAELAIKMCSEAVKLDPSAANYCLRAELWMMMDEADLAGGDLDDALDLEPENAYAHMVNGGWHQLYGDDEDALASYNDAIRYAPSESRYRYRRALFRYETDDYEGAMSDLRHVDRGSRTNEHQNNLMRRLRGKCQYFLGETEGAVDNLVEIIDTDVIDVESFLILGWISVDLERHDAVPIYLEAAIGLDTENLDPRAFESLIDYYFSINEEAKAFEASDRMTDRFPDVAFGWFVYGLCHMESDKQQAIKFVRHATELDPEDERFQHALKTLLSN